MITHMEPRIMFISCGLGKSDWARETLCSEADDVAV